MEIAAQGPCNAPPEFAGVGEASNPAMWQCTLQLAWAAASPLCGGPVVYDVHRGTTPSFVPAPENLVAQGLSGNTWADAGSLSSGEARYYVVRARDLANGLQDGNLVRASAAPTGPTLVSTLAETFQGPGGFDLPGWSHLRTVPPPSDPSTAPGWTWVQGAWFADEHSGSPNGKVLVSPAFGIGPKTALRFRHRFALQSEPWYCRDGGTLEVSTDNGATWKVNVTVTGAQGQGHLQLYPANLRHPPPTSFLSFSPGKTKANNGIVMLSNEGRFLAVNGSPAGLHLIVDVSGYFQ